jgi:type II secretory pathway component PulF
MSHEPAHTEPSLGTATAEAVVSQLAHLTGGGGSLGAGLRAAAEESRSFRLRRALLHLAGEVDRGRPLDDIVAATTRRLPTELGGLIRASQRTGHLGVVLAEWLENRRAARQHWSEVVAAIAYPVITLALANVIFVLFCIGVIQPFEQIIEDWGLRVPANLPVLLWIGGTGVYWYLAGLASLAAVLVGWRLIGGAASFSWLVSQTPIIGPTWHWTGVSEMLRSLALLVEHRVPLPEALRLTGGGITDANVGRACRLLATRVEQGSPLYMAIIQARSLPLSIVPLIRWGEMQGVPEDGLRAAAEMLEGRLRVRSVLAIHVLPPLVFLFIGICTVSVFGTFMSTILSVLQGLA